MNANLQFIASLSVLSFSAIASAQEAPAPPPPTSPPPTIQLVQPATPAAAPAPKIDLSTEPVAPPVQRTYHFHEGFYFRASLGFGDYRASYNDAHRQNLDFNEHGGSMSMDLLIGGSPSPGVSIGGGLLLEPLFGPNYERDGGERLGSHGGFATLIGPFIDGFPDPTKGWHLGALIGLAGQRFQNVNAFGSDSHTASGIGGAAWFGYDFWVANEWAIGPQVRMMGMRTSDTTSGEDVSGFARSFTLGISAVFN